MHSNINSLYSIHTDGGITTITLASEINVALIKNVIDDLVKLPSCPKRVWDLSSVEFDWSTHDLKVVAEYANDNFKSKYKAAFVSDDPLVYGELRQFQALSNDIDGLKICVFKTKNDALKWLID